MNLKRTARWSMAILLIASVIVPAVAVAAPRPTVTGTVYGTDGLAIPAATIQVSELFKGAFRPVATLITDANGQWSYTNKDNTYRFDFGAPSADPQSHELLVEKGGSYTLDVTLQSYGAIAGIIRDSATSAALPGAVVEFYHRNGDGTWPDVPAASTTTAADGSYSGSPLPTGVYAVKATAAGYVTAFFGGATIDLAAPVTVLRAVTSDASFALTPAQAEGTGSISGVVVSGASRVPMGSVYIWLYKQKADGTWPATSPGWGTPDVSLRSASDGTWSSGPIPLGNYRVRFFTTHTGSQWWQYVTTFDQATTLTLSYDGQAVTGIEGWFYMP